MGAGDVRAAGDAEAPGAIDGLRDPNSRPGEDLRLPSGRRRRQQERVATEVGAVVREADAERLGEPARARAELIVPGDTAASAHLVEALRRLQGADQHRGR